MSVVKLPFHLEGKQLIIFKGKDNMEKVVTRKLIEKTMMLAWFQLNLVNAKARELTYIQILNFFVYIAKEKRWKERERDRYFYWQNQLCTKEDRRCLLL